MIVGEFNTPLSMIDRPSRNTPPKKKEIRKETSELNETLSQM
jgi:hypothetical protein